MRPRRASSSANIPSKPGKPRWPVGVLDRLPVEVRHRAARMDHRVDVLRPEEPLVAGVSARLVREQVGLGVRRGSADRRSLGAVDAEADEVRESLPGIRGDLACLVRAGAEDGRNVDRGVLEHGVRRADHADVTAGARERNPWRRSDLAVLVDHLGREVRLPGRSGWIEQRCRPVGERDPAAGRAVRLEVAEAVRDRLPHPIGVDAGQRRQDPRRGVRDQDRVVVREQGAVAADEVQQVRHLLEVRRDVSAVPQEMRVVELNLDHVLDAVRKRAVAPDHRLARLRAGRLGRDTEHGGRCECDHCECGERRSVSPSCALPQFGLRARI